MLHGRSAETARIDELMAAALQELWRLAAYPAIVAVTGNGPVGRQYLDRLAGAVRRYR